MLRDRYEPMDLFALVPQLALAMDPVQAQLDHLLDDDVLFARVKADLAKRYPLTRVHGRPSTPVEVILRMLVVQRLYGWSFEETEHFVADSLVLRQFCRLYVERAPDDTTLIRWANLIGPATLSAVNDRVVELARSLRVTKGRKLRVDTTVVETNVHHPTDSALLGDGIRVVGRLLRRAKAVVPDAAKLGKRAFTSHARTARRLARQMHRTARRKGEEAAEAMKDAYEHLIRAAKQTVGQGQRVLGTLKDMADTAHGRLVHQLDRVLPLLEKGIDQAHRRVLQGGTVPAREKVLSLFEPHTQVIRRYKAGHDVEFGRKIVLDEVDGGIVSRYDIVENGGGQDYAHLMESVDGHKARFGKAPYLLAGDRGLYSKTNEVKAAEAGVKRVVLPYAGTASGERKAHERQRWFRKGFRFRAGIEGRISVLRRRFRLDRCLYQGEAGLGRWVGWGIVASNLNMIATKAANRASQ